MTLPSEALPATVLEIDETEKVVNEKQRIIDSDNHSKEYRGNDST